MILTLGPGVVRGKGTQRGVARLRLKSQLPNLGKSLSRSKTFITFEFQWSHLWNVVKIPISSGLSWKRKIWIFESLTSTSLLQVWWAWETTLSSHINLEIPQSCGRTRRRNEKGHKATNTERKCIHEPLHKMPSKDILWVKPRLPIKKQNTNTNKNTNLTDGGPKQPQQKGGWCSF